MRDDLWTRVGAQRDLGREEFDHSIGPIYCAEATTVGIQIAALDPFMGSKLRQQGVQAAASDLFVGLKLR